LIGEVLPIFLVSWLWKIKAIFDEIPEQCNFTLDVAVVLVAQFNKLVPGISTSNMALELAYIKEGSVLVSCHCSLNHDTCEALAYIRGFSIDRFAKSITHQGLAPLCNNYLNIVAASSFSASVL